MNARNPQVDPYFTDGCGRCPLGGTPECKVHNWPEELVLLRDLVLDCGLTEELKWGVPCYTYNQSNVAVVSAFKEYCSLSFFKGSLINDTEGILEKPGENTQSARLVRMTSVQQVLDLEPVLRTYVHEAIEIEKAGLKVDFKEKNELVYPEELEQKLDASPDLRAAFEALTPGRQRGYVLHFSAPKQSKTRTSRIEKCIPQIMEGKGLHDR